MMRAVKATGQKQLYESSDITYSCHIHDLDVQRWHPFMYSLLILDASCHVMSCHVRSCYLISCFVSYCHDMTYHVVYCHVISCHDMLCVIR